jgi:hypothetical protein
MKLSKAIRKGSEQTVRGTGMYFMGKYKGEIVACVLGSAWIAEKGTEGLEECNSHSLSLIWPELAEPHEAPEGTRRDTNLWGVITSLNDNADWSPEDIASWLEREGL